MENYSGPYENEMHERYLELISIDNPNMKAQSQWTDEDWRIYNYEQEKEQHQTPYQL